MEVQQPFYEVAVELDEEDLEALHADCRQFVALMIERGQPQYIQHAGLDLLKRLDEVLNWTRVH